MLTLKQVRNQYKPLIPKQLHNLHHVLFVADGEATSCIGDALAIQEHFPQTFGRPYLKASEAPALNVIPNVTQNLDLGTSQSPGVERSDLAHISNMSDNLIVPTAGAFASSRNQILNHVGYTPLRVGVLFSGGQAAGGHNVITGLVDALKKFSQESRLFGFLGGPSGIISNTYQELTETSVASFRNTGGFDLIGSGRTKIETDEQLASCLRACQELRLDGLVIIGGDDSNTNAAILAEYFLGKECLTRLIGIPKTIDGDLTSDQIVASFGFDTACRVYSEMIGNICQDALSAKKYTHFIKLMGRSASHIALECALKTHPNLTFIGEEGGSLASCVTTITDLVVKRSKLGKNYGVILIPEGLIEFFPEIQELIQRLNQKTPLTGSCQELFLSLPESIQRQLQNERDPHGNVQVAQIETEQLLIELVQHELRQRFEFKGKFTPMRHFFGYEGRAAFPTNFDANYCYSLGTVAALLIAHKKTGYIATVEKLDRPVAEWKVGASPITSLMHLEMRKGALKPVIKKRLVDLDGKPFQLFKSLRKSWSIEDDYRSPGPIQFSGEDGLINAPPLSITL